MKTPRLWILVALALGLSSWALAQIDTDPAVPVMFASPTYAWRELGSITSAQDLPDVGDRNYTDVMALADAKTFIWHQPNWGRRAMLSFQTSADADSTTIVLLGFAGPKMVDRYGTISLDDDAVYLGQLVLTGGTQVGSYSNVYVDTIVPTDGICTFSVLDSAANRRAVVVTNFQGFRTIVGIATTLQASSTLRAFGRLL